MLRVGLTGGIGSGKTTVCQHFAALATPIVDTDELAREVVAKGEPLLEALKADFGPSILTPAGTLDRTAMREQVFANKEKLALLEQHLHPAIRTRLQQCLATLKAPYVIIAIPLLIEKGWQAMVDRVLVVDCSEQQQLERASRRDRCPPEQVRQIMMQQCTRQQRLAVADDIIHNDGASESLASQVAKLHRRYLEQQGA